MTEGSPPQLNGTWIQRNTTILFFTVYHT